MYVIGHRAWEEDPMILAWADAMHAAFGEEMVMWLIARESDALEPDSAAQIARFESGHGGRYRKRHAEVIREAYHAGCSFEPLTAALVLHWHRSLFPHGGQFKEADNYIIGADGAFIDTTPPRFVPSEIGGVAWDVEVGLRNLESPCKIAAKAHVRFVRIHPFIDGNGRVARILTQYVMGLCGEDPVCLRESDRRLYLDCLQSERPEERLASLFSKRRIRL